MAQLNEFITYLLNQVDRAIYVWGAQGQKANAEWIKKKETGSNQRNALATYERRVDAGVNPVLAFDCSGLGMYWLYNLTRTFNSDLNANGMQGKCKIITRGELKRGDWVFKCNSTGRAIHIGYVVDEELNVVESRGRAYGVVMRPLSKGSWNRFGRPIVFADEIESAEPAVWHVKRTLKRGCVGTDVQGLQKRLMNAGFSLPRYGADGDFGTETENAVTAYKLANGMTATGLKAGWVTKTMVLRLGGVWK